MKLSPKDNIGGGLDKPEQPKVSPEKIHLSSEQNQGVNKAHLHESDLNTRFPYGGVIDPDDLDSYIMLGNPDVYPVHILSGKYKL